MNKLYRSQRDKKLCGLCGGLAEYFHIDATILRLIMIVTAVFSGGTVLLIYVLASIVIPKEPSYRDPYSFGSDPFNKFNKFNNNGPSQYTNGPTQTHSYHEPVKPNLDDMMKDIEKKALRKEIEDLRSKLSKYEKGE